MSRRRAASPAPERRNPPRRSERADVGVLRDDRPASGYGLLGARLVTSRYVQVLKVRFTEDGKLSHHAFKEAVLKDMEVNATAGNLIMTIAFAGLTITPYHNDNTLSWGGALAGVGKESALQNWQMWLRLLYVLLTMAAAALACFAFLFAMRTQLMLTLHPAELAADLLDQLAHKYAERRVAGLVIRRLYPFDANKYAVVALLAAASTYVLCIYSWVEFVVCFLIRASQRRPCPVALGDGRHATTARRSEAGSSTPLCHRPRRSLVHAPLVQGSRPGALRGHVGHAGEGVRAALCKCKCSGSSRLR